MNQRRISITGILGTGWTFPVAPDPQSRRLEYLAGPDKVRTSIITILETEPGERIMRPTFGCGLQRYLMKPNTHSTRTLIQRDVELALSTWEPRIQVQRVDVEPGDDPALVLIGIHYVHRHNSQPDNFVYPLYLE